MTIPPEKTIKAIERYFQTLKDKGAPYTRWRQKLVPVTGWNACKFFIGHILDQRQPVERAWWAAEEFVERRNGHWSPKTFWEHFAEMNMWKLRKYCQFLPERKYTGSYAGINAKKFPKWFKENARIIVKKYGIVENIWQEGLSDVNEEKIEEIHNRFADFSGIGENLANMATFSLVRDHGYAGGWKSRKFLKMKFDTHVNRVISRAIISGNPELGNARSYVKVLNGTLDSPADFDRAVFAIGQDFCQYDDCENCPINDACNAWNDKIVDKLELSEVHLEFFNGDPHCFEKFEIQSFELTYASCKKLKNFGGTISCDPEGIKQFNEGITVQNNEFEATIRMKESGFILSISRSEFFR